MKKFCVFLALISLSLVTTAQEYNVAVDSIISQVKLDSLILNLRALSGEDTVMVNGEPKLIEHRVSNWGNDLAADYIKERLDNYGLEVTDQVYTTSGRNIFALQEGLVYPEQYYIICAHYDAVDFYCADDNGSGSAAVLETARIFSEMEFEYSIIYALWDEEEIGLIGSEYFASQADITDEDILSVINMDMIAWDGDDDMAVEIHSSFTASSNVLSDYIVEVNNLYGLGLTPSIEIPGTSASDHSRFWNHGYKAVLLIEEYYGGDFNPYYHSEQDRIEILNMPYFHEMAKLAIGSLASMASPIISTTNTNSLMAENTGCTITNYPNPANEFTKIIYSLQKGSNVTISLINDQGNKIKDLISAFENSGTHELNLSANDLKAGMYLLVMQCGSDIVTHKMMVR
ncbi:MAG: M28 family peptidase [Bacteroidales bacterium]|nr:M28 family peptidase [Bacteroidales bacterium]